MKKILFIADLNTYGRSYLRYKNLISMGYSLTSISHMPIAKDKKIKKPSLIYRISNKLSIPLDVTNINKSILQVLKKQHYDIIWIETCISIFPSTLKKIKFKYTESKLISLSEDDMFPSHNNSIWYKLGLKYFDFVYTTKVHNLEDLKLFKGKNITLFLDSFDSNLHKPVKLNKEDKSYYGCDVSAIGAYEEERAQTLLFLANKKIKVSVWGNGWQKFINIHPFLNIKNKFLYSEEYVKAINASKINLNFLRKINRDQITSRSMEIPACNGFMLAERTPRHKTFFKEGVEAEFFGNDTELLCKVNFYLKNSDKRIAIANLGYQRCIKSGYSMAAQLKIIINKTL